MNENFAVEPEVLRAKLVQETAQIAWSELAKFYAAGVVVMVQPQLDLIDVAYAMSQDQSAQVAHWLAEGQVQRVSDGQALSWHEQQATLWAVVVSPWVLVQALPPHS